MFTFRTLSAIAFLLLYSLNASAGDSIYGNIVDAQQADVLVLQSGPSKYVIHLVGLSLTDDKALAQQALTFVEHFVRGKGARARIVKFTRATEISGRILIDEKGSNVKDLGIELISAGFAKSQTTPAYKYQENKNAEDIARAQRRGIWKQSP
jgi:endonuclease YncB( thermonuclease family)